MRRQLYTLTCPVGGHLLIVKYHFFGRARVSITVSCIGIEVEYSLARLE